MKITLLPKTRAGKWSAVLFVIFIIFSVLAENIPGLAKSPDLPDIVRTPVYASLIYLGLLAAIIAAVTGIKSIRKYSERSVLVYLSIPVGLLLCCGILIMILALIADLFIPK